MKELIPDYEFEDVTKIDEKIFSNKELIIFDVDNTLVYSETADVKEDILRWFKRIDQKYSCVCFSNSHTIKKRKEDIEKKLGCRFFFSRNKKPSRHLFREIIKEYEVPPEKVVVIGDFRFTDVMFGKRSGATAILVKPIGPDNSKRLKIMRKMEALFFKVI
jgi:HAD superfamily phosphatase (TIGR01668 family)